MRESLRNLLELNVIMLCAGSGKSTFTTELQLHIETEHRKRSDKDLILIKVNLPALTNPLSDLFRESLSRGYGLREAQIDELRELARTGDVELMFLLDAYDELREEVSLSRDRTSTFVIIFWVCFR